MKRLKDFYSHLSYPSINGIAFPDGSAIPLLFDITWVPKIEYKTVVERSINYDNIEAYNEVNWKDCAVMFSLEIDEKEVLIISGESDYGSDRFVAILAFSINGSIWRFPLDKPHELSTETSD